MTKQEIKAKIDKLENGIKSKATPYNLIAPLKAQKAKFEKELEQMESAEKKAVKTKKMSKVAEKIKAAKISVAKKTPAKAPAKEERKKDNIARDGDRKSLPSGKRISKSGKVYYENRANRSDKQTSKKPYLADGGMTDGMASVNEIARLTGLRPVAVAEWGDKNNINLSVVLKDLKAKKIKGMDLMTAVVGKPNNKYQKELLAKYSKNKMAYGGDTEDGVDLFEDYENIPTDVQKILDKHSDAFEDGDYRKLEKANNELKKIGYTFEYGLDGEAYDLRKIGQKGKMDEDEYADGGAIKGKNNQTGETYGVVIGSIKKADDELEGATKMNVRNSYNSRISEVELIFDKNGNLYRITDFGYGLEGNYPSTGTGSGRTYNADKKETLQILSSKYTPAFAKKLIGLAKGSMAHGGFIIFEGRDNYNNKPLYKVISKDEDNDYEGEFHNNREDAEKELNELKNKNMNYANGGSTSSDVKIKDFYVKKYPMDELGIEINENSTFDGLYKVLDNEGDVYHYIGVQDSLVRERVFEKLSELMGIEYDVIYKKWLESDFEPMFDKGGNTDTLYTKLVEEHSKGGYERMGVGFDRFLKMKMESASAKGNMDMYYKLMDVEQMYENDFYAKGGYMADGGSMDVVNAEISTIRRNIMGTTSFMMKIKGMRNPQDFSVYPISADQAGQPITIQSDTRFGFLDLSSGRGLMSQSHANGAYSYHFTMDKKVPFKISETDLQRLKDHISGTAGSSVGNMGISSDNSGASMMADGGSLDKFYEVKYTDSDGITSVVGKFIDETEAYTSANKLTETATNRGKFGTYFVEKKEGKFKDGGYMAKGGQVPAHFGSGKNIEVFGYETKNFDICATAVKEFEAAVDIMKDSKDMEKESLAYCAKYVDNLFGIEKVVVEGGIGGELNFSHAVSDIMSAATYNFKAGMPINLYSFVPQHLMEISLRLAKAEKGGMFSLGGMTAGRFYKDKNGEEFKFIGKVDSGANKGRFLFTDGQKSVYKDLEDFEGGKPKENKLFSFFEEGGMLIHGFQTGDNILQIYKGYGIVENNNNGVIEVLDPNRGTRFIIDLDESKPTGSKSVGMSKDEQMESAKRYIDYLDRPLPDTLLEKFRAEGKMEKGGYMADGGFTQYGEPMGFEEESDSVYEIHHKSNDNSKNPYLIWDKIDGVYIAEFPNRQRALHYIYNKSLGMMADGGKVPNTYIPNKNIKELMVILNNKSLNLKGSDILDGVYAKNSALNTFKKRKSVSSVDEIYEAIITRLGDEKDDIESVKKEDIKRLVDVEYDLKDIELMYFGVNILNPKIDVSYGNSGLLGLTQEGINNNIERLVRAAKNKSYEIGLKYPEFDWSSIVKKYKISKDGKQVNGEERDFGREKEYYVYTIFEGNKVVVGTSTDRVRFKDGKKLPQDSSYQKDAEELANFEGGYWGLVTSSKEVMYDILEMILSQKGKYVKDLNLFVNRLGGIGYEELDKNNIKYAKGGEVDKELIDSSAKTIYDRKGMMSLRNTFLQVAKADEDAGDKETAEYRRKVVAEYQAKQPRYMAKGGEIAFDNSNLYLNGFGIDSNGNSVVKVSFPNQRAFSIQTNGVLNETNSLYTKNIGKLTEAEIKTIEKEVVDYVKKFGSKEQKQRLKTYSGFMAKGGTTKFADQVKSVKASLLKRKKVAPQVQKDYGKTYDKAEAQESAKRIVGSRYANLKDKMSKMKK